MKLPDRDPQYVALVQVLRARREGLKISQWDLGRMLGVSHGYLANWESGKNVPNAEMLFTWCRVLEVNLKAVPMFRPSTSHSKDQYSGSSSSPKSVDTGT